MNNIRNKILDIGCGNRKTQRSIGIDCNQFSDSDMVCDLNKFSYFFQDNLSELI